MFEILPIINFCILIGALLLIAILKVEVIALRNELEAHSERLTEARREVFALKGEVEALAATPKPMESEIDTNEGTIQFWQSEIRYMVASAERHGIRIEATARIDIDE